MNDWDQELADWDKQHAGTRAVGLLAAILRRGRLTGFEAQYAKEIVAEWRVAHRNSLYAAAARRAA